MITVFYYRTQDLGTEEGLHIGGPIKVTIISSALSVTSVGLGVSLIKWSNYSINELTYLCSRTKNQEFVWYVCFPGYQLRNCSLVNVVTVIFQTVLLALISLKQCSIIEKTRDVQYCLHWYLIWILFDCVSPNLLWYHDISLYATVQGLFLWTGFDF